MFIRTYSRKGLNDESWRWIVIYEGLKAERKEARRIRYGIMEHATTQDGPKFPIS